MPYDVPPYVDTQRREVSGHGLESSVLNVEMVLLYRPSKGISVDKQANDNVVHLCRFGETDHLPDQTFNTCLQR